MNETTLVKKRDGASMQPFDGAKIRRAITRAWCEARPMDEANPSKLDKQVEKIAARVAVDFDDVDEVTVEQLQDAVEYALIRAHRHDVARAFIVHRQKRSELREDRPTADHRAVGEYIHASKYARWREDLGRRETFIETVARVEDMHARRYPRLADKIAWAFDQVRAKRVLPSMRAMQFAGEAVEAINLRQYNCAATLIDRPRVFAELLYLLLCGTGTGYSVQFEHVEKLPALATIGDETVHHVIGDDIAGWGDAVDALARSYMVPTSDEYGKYVEFSFHQIRKRGARLRTSGGRAPGHKKLKESLERIRAVFDGASGRKMRPIECHRVCCHLAAAVLSGGIRRSAMICLFSPEDGEIMACKADRSWFSREPWLAYANNSAVMVRGEVTRKQFHRIFEMARGYGEPGVYMVNHRDHAANPCNEAGLCPTIWASDVYRITGAHIGEPMPGGKDELLTGWSFCNLTEINASLLKSKDDFLLAAEAATFIGTLQASYTDMPYLGVVSEAITRRDALLGVGMTGVHDAPMIALDPDIQREVAERIVEWNRAFASQIGVNSAARTTLVKPSGTSSLELDYVASGHHPHHARRIIRRVTADELEVPFQAFRAANPHACVRMPDGKWSIEFALEAPAGATLREDIGAIKFVEQVLSTQHNWVEPGTGRESSPNKGQRHNVSNTISVKTHEWDELEEHLWKNRQHVGGVSMLPDDGDTVYPFAPFEAVKTEAQEVRWRELVQRYQPVDYMNMIELEDGTMLSGEAACAGGQCDWNPRKEAA